MDPDEIAVEAGERQSTAAALKLWHTRFTAHALSG